MTDHLKELELAWGAARQRAREAMQSEREAKQKYRDALFEATGFKGCVAEAVNMTRGKPSVTRFVVTGLGSWSDRYIRGPIIKKDGTVGTREVDCRIETTKNLGPWQPPA